MDEVFYACVHTINYYSLFMSLAFLAQRKPYSSFDSQMVLLMYSVFPFLPCLSILIYPGTIPDHWLPIPTDTDVDIAISCMNFVFLAVACCVVYKHAVSYEVERTKRPHWLLHWEVIFVWGSLIGYILNMTGIEPSLFASLRDIFGQAASLPQLQMILSHKGEFDVWGWSFVGAEAVVQCSSLLHIIFGIMESTKLYDIFILTLESALFITCLTRVTKWHWKKVSVAWNTIFHTEMV